MFFFSYFSQLLRRHHFLTRVIPVKWKILYILMQWSKWFIFWNILLYCKIIISFLELFSATCFLCILKTHLTKRNTSIPKKVKTRQHMTFMMSSNNKMTFVNFFINTYSILSIHYMYKISCKVDKKSSEI